MRNEANMYDIIAPIVEHYKTLNSSERTTMFEDSLAAAAYAVVENLRALGPKDRDKLIKICAASDASDDTVFDEWEDFWEDKGIRYLQHPMYLSLFVLIIDNAAKFAESLTREEVSHLSKVLLQNKSSELAEEVDEAADEILREFKPKTIN